MPVICFSVAYLFVNDSLINKTSILHQLLHRICICLVYQKPCKTFSPNITKKTRAKVSATKNQKSKMFGFKQHSQICKKQNKDVSKKEKTKTKLDNNYNDGNAFFFTFMVSLRSDSIVFKQMITHLIGTSYEVWQWYRLKVCHT